MASPNKSNPLSNEMAGGSPSAARLLQTGKYSDLEIRCGSKIFKVHRNVICFQSKPLADCVDGGFLVISPEATTGVIKLDDSDPGIVELFINFLYTHDYHPPTSAELLNPSHTSADSVAHDLSAHAKLYVMADKCDIPALKSLSSQKYKAALPREGLGNSFILSLKVGFEEIPDSERLLKDKAIEFEGQNYKELLERGEFVNLCEENGQIAMEFLRATVAVAAKNLFPSKCPDCSNVHYIERKVKKVGKSDLLVIIGTAR
ncbi:uncharacterized protein BP5553_00911 [Venustampulla echinocandica]|uniref:BTB domain-containing protein n=1 Tax=Venustampulla echinocandica TaxID=2656787 RepID=A0A370TZH4_9HELO|nr:uncharacterized protein BP5553_00911 [Venustampulla echinocandica]RDL40932.1 hypothetical protein BP5553_00911 [Venustampulla echinocandica]